jgi:hypothetical protein
LDKLDENFSWGESEDVEWSKKIRNNFKYIMNENSIVHLLKQKMLSATYV